MNCYSLSQQRAISLQKKSRNDTRPHNRQANAVYFYRWPKCGVNESCPVIQFLVHCQPETEGIRPRKYKFHSHCGKHIGKESCRNHRKRWKHACSQRFFKVLSVVFSLWNLRLTNFFYINSGVKQNFHLLNLLL